MRPTLGGTVSPDGELVLDKPRLYRRYLQTLIGEKVVLILRRPSEIRSLNQNAYYHSVVVALLAQEWGTTDREAHELIKREFGVGSTAALEVGAFELLMERIRGWALTDHNVTIPAPNEVV